MAQRELVLTVDVEPDWGFEGVSAVRSVLPKLLDRLRHYGAKATFFVVAALLEECGETVRSVLPDHEIGSHGLTHRCFHRMSKAGIELELTESRRRLEDLGAEVQGCRAPWLRTPPGWSDMLRRAGYRYDSSTGRCRPSLRNISPRQWRVEETGGVLVAPPCALRDGITPCSLTYLRLLAPFGERLIDPEAPVFYMHLHELMPPETARVAPAPLRWLARRNAGEPAWAILERLLASRRGSIMSCREYLDRKETGS